MADLRVTQASFEVFFNVGVFSAFNPGAVLDDWQTTGGPPPSTDWSTSVTVSLGDSGGLQIVTPGIAEATLASGLNTAWYSVATFPSAVDLSVEIEELPDSGGAILLFARLADAVGSFETGVMAKWRRASATSSDSMELWVISGGDGELVASFNVSMSTDLAFALDASGDTMTLLQGTDWLSTGAATITSISQGGYIGVGIESKGTGQGKIKNPRGRGKGPPGGGGTPPGLLQQRGTGSFHGHAGAASLGRL